MPATPLRIAAIEFLNAAPLMWGLEAEERCTLFHTLPSACAEALREERAELGVIPVIELTRIPRLVGLSGIGVAAGAGEPGEVRSILLVCRKPVAEVRKVALDRASRTSAALTRILLRRWFGAGSVEFIEGGRNWERGLQEAEAALVIGDPALRLRIGGEAERRGHTVYDLATEWRRWSGLPFVFAVWGIRETAWEQHREWLEARLRRALQEGLTHRDSLVEQWAPRLHLPPQEIRRYLAENVEYRLSAAHVAGLSRFLTLAQEDGLIPAGALPRLRSGSEAAA